MGVALLVYQFPLPLFLFLAILGKFHVFSLLYVIAFLLVFGFFPHDLLALQKPIVRSVTLYVLVVSSIETLALIVFQVAYTAIGLESFLGDFPWVKYLGLTPGSALDTLLKVLPSLLIFIVSLFILISIRRFYPRTPSRTKPNSLLYASVAWFSLLLLGVSSPNVINFVFFTAWVGLFLLFGLFQLNVSLLVKKFWTPLYVLVILNLLAQVFAQQDFFLEVIPYEWRKPLGLLHYSQLKSDWYSVGVVGGWFSLVTLFWAISLFRRNTLVRSVLKRKRPQYLDDGEVKVNGRNVYNMKNFLRVALETYGRYLCIFLLLFHAVFWPSILSYVLVAVVFVTTFLRRKALYRSRIFHFLMVYLVFYMCAVMLYNIDFPFWRESDALKNLGFVRREPSYFWFTPPAIVYVIVSVFWYLRHSNMKQKFSLEMSQMGGGNVSDHLAQSTANGVSVGGSLNVNKSRVKTMSRSVSFERRTDHSTESTTSQLISLPKSSSDASVRQRGSETTSMHSPRAASPELLESTLSTGLETSAQYKAPPSLPNMTAQIVFTSFKKLLWYISLPFVKYSHFVSVAGLYLSASASANVINAGYIVFFIFAVIVPRRVLARSWLVLVVYSQLAFSAVYLWQMSWTEEYDNTLVANLTGLTHFETQPELVFSSGQYGGLIWHLIIIAFSFIQLGLTRVFKRRLKSGTDSSPKWMQVVFEVGKYTMYRYGIWFVYVALLLVPTYSRRSLINFIYLILLFISLNIHMIVKKYDVALRHQGRYWIFVCVATGLIFVTRYIAQFQLAYEFLKEYIPDGSGEEGSFGLLDLGLQKSDDPRFELFGNAIVFVSAVYQQKNFYRKKIPQITHLQKTSNFIRILVAFLKRFLMLHMPKIALLVLVIVALSYVSVLNMVYLLVVIFCTPLKSGSDNIGLIVMLYTQILILAKMIYQFPAREGAGQIDLFKWIGFREATNSVLIGGEVAIIFVLTLQRISERWRHDYKREIAQNGNPKNHPDRLTLFLYNANYHPSKHFTFSDLLHQTRYYLSNVFSIHKFQFFLIAVLVGVLIHEDVVAVAYFIVAVLSIAFPQTNITSGRLYTKLLIIVFTLLLVMEYFYSLKLPEVVEEKYPWYNLTVEVQRWLGVRTDTPYILLAEFFVLSVLSRIINSVEPDFQTSSYSNVQQLRSKDWFAEMRYFVLRNSIYWTLFIVFLASSVKPSLLSLGYLTFALFFLYSTNRVFKHRNNQWRYARLYNILVIFVKLGYQAPFISLPNQVGSWASVIGLQKYSDGTAGTSALIGWDIVVFVFLGIQKAILTRREYGSMVKSMLTEQARGLEEAMDRYELYLGEREKIAAQLRLDRLRRRQQLKLLKIYRKRQELAWAKAAEGMNALEKSMLSEQQAVKTTADIRKLEKTGAITYSVDETGKKMLHLDAKTLERKSDSGSTTPTPRNVPTSLNLAMDELDLEEESDDFFVPPPATTSSFLPSRITAKMKTLGHGIQSRVTRARRNSHTVHNAALTTRGRIDQTSPMKKGSAHNSANNSAHSSPSHHSQQEPLVTSRNYLESRKPKKEKIERADAERVSELKDDDVHYEDVSMKKTLIGFLDQFLVYLDDHSYMRLSVYRGRSRLYQLLVGLYQFLATHSQSVCYFFLLLNAVLNINLISLFYPLTLFFYCLLARPRPSKNYWKIVIIYVSLVLVAKFIAQLPIFCMCFSLDNVSSWTTEPYCREPACNYDSSGYSLSIPELVGLVKYGEGPNDRSAGLFTFLSYTSMDIIVLVSVLVHRHFLKKFGYWNHWQEQYETENEYLAQGTSKRDKTILQEKRRSLFKIKLAKKMGSWAKYESQHIRKYVAKMHREQPTRDMSKYQIQDVENPIFDSKLLSEMDAKTDVSVAITNPLYTGTPLDSDSDDSNSSPHFDDEDDDGVFEGGTKSTVPSTSKSVPVYFTQYAKFDIDYLVWEDRHAQNTVGIAEINKVRSKIGSTVGDIFKSIPRYFSNIFTENPTASDFYIFIFGSEFISLLFLIFFPGTIVGTQGLIDFVSSNSIPSAWVFAIFAQFIMMVVDRTLYLYRAIRLKLMLHYISIVFYHVLIFFILPSINQQNFTDLPELVWFYLFKLTYLLFSSLQIGYGFPLRVQGQVIASNTKDPSIIVWILFFAYKALPFVYELRVLIDWTVTPTTLTLFEWLKMEDIFANLFMVKCRIEFDRVTVRNIGEEIPWYVKVGMGVGITLVFIALLFVPLFLFMQGTSASLPNLIVEMDAKVSLSGFSPLYQRTASAAKDEVSGSISSVDRNTFGAIRSLNPWIQQQTQEATQAAVLPRPSVKWQIADTVRAELINQLNNTDIRMSLTTHFQWRRLQPEERRWQEYIYIRNLEVSERQAFITAIMATSPSLYNVTIANVFPIYFDIPVLNDVSPAPSFASVVFTRHIEETIVEVGTSGSVQPVSVLSEHWEMDTVNATYPLETAEVQIVTVSAEILTGIITALTSSGIIGFYVGIVLAVGRFLRIALMNLGMRVIYEDMWECEELLELCMDMYMAREDKDLELEENLFRELIDLYRSPERMILRTDPKGRSRFRFYGDGRPEQVVKKEKKDRKRLEAYRLAHPHRRPQDERHPAKSD